MKRETLKKIGIVAGAGIAYLGGIGTMALLQQNNKPAQYEHIYERTYADAGECLHGTPYDPSNGASVNLNRIQRGEDVLSVVPESANAYRPSVLFFTAGDGKLLFADHTTGSFLADAHCPVPSGM